MMYVPIPAGVGDQYAAEWWVIRWSSGRVRMYANKGANNETTYVGSSELRIIL